MAEIPRTNNDVYEDDFFVVTDDPDERMINVAFVERGLVMRFDYEEFLEFGSVIEQTRGHVQRRMGNTGQNGH